MNRLNFQTSEDGGHPIRDKFDQNHAVTSPGYSSRSRHSPQRTKMPTLLLRLDSEGEVCTVNLPSENLSPAKSRPVLHSQSLDSDIVSKTARRLFSGSAMAKLLCPRNSVLPTSVQIESHNLSQKPQPESSAFYGMKTFSSSFDSYQKSSFLHDMNTILMPSKINEYNLFGSHSHQTFKDLENNLPPAVSCSLSASIFSIAKACAACHTSSSGCSVSASARSTPSDKDSSSYGVVSPGEPVTDVLCQNCESTAASLSPSLGKCALDESSLSVVFQPENKTHESSSKSESVTTEEKGLTEGSVANGECKQTEDYSGSCDKLKCNSSQNSKSDEASCSSLMSVADLSSVLSLPRKTTKKGRPSSRKQRKRQREKQKTCSVPLVSKISSLNAEKKHLFNCSQSEEDDSSSVLFEASCSQSPGRGTPRESTPVKSQARHCPISSFFFGGRSDSEEVDESDGGDLCEGTGDWSASEDETMQTLPKKCVGFSAPLNLDSVFKKQSIPTLKSVFWGEDSDSESEASPAAGPKVCQSSALDTSKEDCSGDSSIDFSSPLSSPSKSFGFTCGLSIEVLFAKKPHVVCQAAEKESGVDTVDGVPSSAGNCQLSTGFEVCYESISKINARWNEDYPSAGFRSCQAISSEEIKDPSIKVHFASGPSFVTIHFVGTEERGGTWHHFALDRERFQRRILDVASVLSPVFEASHRAKVMKRNQQN